MIKIYRGPPSKLKKGRNIVLWLGPVDHDAKVGISIFVDMKI